MFTNYITLTQYIYIYNNTIFWGISAPCLLPNLKNGKYDSRYKNNLTVPHGNLVDYNCEPGYVKIVPDTLCQVGRLEPAGPACVDSSEASATGFPQKKSSNLVVRNLHINPEMQTEAS